MNDNKVSVICHPYFDCLMCQAIISPKIYSLIFSMTQNGKIIQYSQKTNNCVLPSLTFMMSPTINLISETHHSCEKREYTFIVLRKYWNLNNNHLTKWLMFAKEWPYKFLRSQNFHLISFLYNLFLLWLWTHLINFYFYFF